MTKQNIDIYKWKVSEITLPESDGLYTFLNPYSYCLARMEPSLFSGFRKIMLDGSFARAAFRILRVSKVKRQSFDNTSIAPMVFSWCVEKGHAVALLGAKKEELESARAVFEESFPGLKIVFSRDGYFDSELEREAALEKIVEASPKVVIVGMGTILQERFLVDLWEKGWRGLGFTCGGFFHQTASSGYSYYPSFIDKLNLRWLYRIYDEPKLLRRYLKYYPLFIVFFINDVFCGRLRG